MQFGVSGAPGTPLGGSGAVVVPRLIVDWGLMANLKSRDAIGASLFVSAAPGGADIGPAIHYRHWLGPDNSIEVALGAPLLASADGVEKTSLYGLVKWRPTNWVALAARPELVRQEIYHYPTTPCEPDSPCPGFGFTTATTPRLALGLEFSRVPGLALTGAGVLAFIVALAMFLGTGGD
ncbi:MAG TPA: hypothetical protein VLT79_08060 [Gemmatimonadales bacterium]|nr:hypothetical protein [Gemmatimonadales bacterium]